MRQSQQILSKAARLTSPNPLYRTEISNICAMMRVFKVRYGYRAIIDISGEKYITKTNRIMKKK